ncbi:response regulator [Candidatus Parabeggiatoa sp. HSG14]|uniref:response regulator n=1 Tax=Candidatus Parabeggiatoa sp. HSG14 TaxID=3055593 RepID=UPI0025A7782B|nr:response regulator [Thiotrichales bacterium HSG14]
MDRQYQLLIVDNNKETLTTYRRYFLQHGIFVEIAHNGVEGLEKFRKEEFDVVLIDIKMPEMNGIEMVKKIREKAINTEIVILSEKGEGEREEAIAAINLNVSAWFEKSPEIMEDLLEKVKDLASLDEIDRLIDVLDRREEE